MEEERARELFEEARAAVRGRIRADCERVSAVLRPLLGHLESCLLEREYDVACLEREGFLSGPVRKCLHRELNVTPKAYLTRWKRATASWLLEETDLQIWQVADLLRYSIYANFNRDFKRWTGETPAAYRQARRDRPIPEDRSLQAYLRAVVGELSSEDALLKKLQVGARVRFRGQGHGRIQAEMVWCALQGFPPSVQEQLLRDEVHFESRILFDFLSEESLRAGRKDRNRGVEMARLALASLEGNADALGDSFYDLAALGWARLGQAEELALNRVAAERAFQRAEELWQTPRAAKDPRNEAEVLLFKGTFRLHERRFDEARELLHRVISICWAEDAPVLLAKCLIQRATLLGFEGDHGAAITDLETARQQLSGKDEAYLLIAVYSNLATSYALLGRPEKALSFLPEARTLSTTLGIGIVRHQLQWVEGLACLAAGDDERAEEWFCRARAGFIRLGEHDHRALVSLELALLRVRQGRSGEAVSLAAEAIPIFKALDAYTDAVTALALLCKGVSANIMTEAVLARARDCLLTISIDPAR